MLETLAIGVCALTNQGAPTIVVDRDDIVIEQTCRVRVGASAIADANGNGVIHIVGDDLTVEFDPESPPLMGARTQQLPDSFAGRGIVITGQNVTIRGAKARGYKVGIHAIQADGLTVEYCDVSDNFAQRLKSTPQSEDAGDWLWPHNNDDHEWINNYGAGLCVENSEGVTVHNVRARRTQNGIIFDSVNDSKVFDCDCSFLSGWGLAMWRSNRNVITRNAFDFCVRGYSHGVYNRGQDSAGILMFEQCCENTFAENSATHGGDGFFGFAGKEALGEVNPQPSPSWYKHRGCDDNVFVENDFSFAAAHGLELTFSFKNRISRNIFKGNAICGIWGGYSQAFIIDGNRFEDNGEGAYGLERGGINIEHGRYNMIVSNRFERDRCGVHLWWDEDLGLMSSIWARANEPFSSGNFIVDNEFISVPLAVQLRQTNLTNVASNRFNDVGEVIDADDESQTDVNARSTVDVKNLNPAIVNPLGETRPVGSRGHLAGRENIIMTDWGPWDHQSPMIQFVRTIGHADEYRVHGLNVEGELADQVQVQGNVDAAFDADRILVRPKSTGMLAPYTIEIELPSGPGLSARGCVSSGAWTVTTFHSPCDPREDVDAWRKGAAQPEAHTQSTNAINFTFGGVGMSEVMKLPSALPRDHFGIVATRTLKAPAGRYRLTALSDDGIRVWLNNELVIDDWTWHAPKRYTHEFATGEPLDLDLRVEYFELDGHAALHVDVVAAP